MHGWQRIETLTPRSSDRDRSGVGDSVRIMDTIFSPSSGLEGEREGVTGVIRCV